MRERVAEPRRLDVPITTRRAELEELQRATWQLRQMLGSLHPVVRGHLVGTLAQDWTWHRDDLRRLREALGALHLAAGVLLGETPPTGGAPDKARRNGLIRAVVAWVDSLTPDRGRAATRAAITRNASRDPINVPLRAPADDRTRRRLESVKTVCDAGRLSFRGDVGRILREVLNEKPP